MKFGAILILGILVSCSPEPVSSFSEIVGCYKTQDGKAVMQIDSSGAVTTANGSRIGLALLQTRGPASVLSLRPGIVISEDGSRAIESGEPTRDHLVDKWRGDVNLALQAQNFEAPATLLIRTPGSCS